MSEVLNIYSVCDEKTGRFITLELFLNDVEAQRFLKSQLSNSKSLMSQFPEDFKLYRLGRFDASNGIINVEGYEKPIWSCDLKDIIHTPSPAAMSDSVNNHVEQIMS